MVVLRMQESQFGAPEGLYGARFNGTAPLADDKPRLGRDNKPMPPAMEWSFTIEQGAYRGRRIGRITSRVPTTRNSCGEMLRGMVGRQILPNEEIDPSVYVGQLYQVVVGPSKDDPTRMQLQKVICYTPGAPPAAPAAPAPGPALHQPPAAPAAPAGPPPLRQGHYPFPPPPQPAPAQRKFWVNTGADQPSLMTEKELRDWIAAQQRDPLTVQICPEGEQAWK